MTSLSYATNIFSTSSISSSSILSFLTEKPFPDTPEFKTLILDPHTHSAFSDGLVMPSIRVEEAVREGIDALAITEHLEFLPHKKDIPFENKNSAYESAKSALKKNQDSSLVIIPGVEITRTPPDHHYNALFIEDANKLYKTDSLMPLQEVFDEAKEQNAFVILNHAWWDFHTLSRDPIATPFQKFNAQQGKLQGMEIANKHSYSAEAFQTAIDLNLTLIGGSDIHGIIDWEFKSTEGEHRTTTLVFAKQNTSDAIREALVLGRTVVWFKNQLIGHNQNLTPLLNASIKVKKAEYRKQQEVMFIKLENHSEVEFLFKNNSAYQLYYNTDIVTLPPHSETLIAIRTGGRKESIKLDFEVLNSYIAPHQHAQISFMINNVNISPQ